MRTKLFVTFILIAVHTCLLQGQPIKDTLKDVKLDGLATPTNPAFVIMGSSPSEITQPASVPEMVIAVQNASNNFTDFPNNFGLAVSPFWFTHGKQLEFKEEFDTINRARLYRHLQVSAGVLGEAGGQANNWRYGLGLKTNILEGKVNADSRRSYDNSLQKVSKAFNEALNNRTAKDEVIQRLYAKKGEYIAQKQVYDNLFPFGEGLEGEDLIKYYTLDTLISRYQDSISSRAKVLDRSDLIIDEGLIKELSKAMQQLYIREGLKWDAGIALSYDLQNNRLDSSSLYRSGVWSNFGYSFKGSEKCRFSMLGAARYFYYGQAIYQLEDESSVMIDNLGVLDAGLRLVLDARKISLSFEGLYRYGLNDVFENTYKLNAMLNYRFSENRMVYFSVGNDFNDVSVEDPSQLRVYVGLNLGFGDKADIEYRLK